MRSTLLSIGIVFVFASATSAQEVWQLPQNPPAEEKQDDAASVLARATKKVEGCDYTSWLPPEARKNRFSLENLFRDGRFYVYFLPEEVFPDGMGRVRGILFTPRPESARLPPQEGETGDFNRLMNHLRGYATVDEKDNLLFLQADIIFPVESKVYFGQESRVTHAIDSFHVTFEREELGQSHRHNFHILMESRELQENGSYKEETTPNGSILPCVGATSQQ